MIEWTSRAVDTLRVDRAFGERLAAVQQVREGRQALRIGWLWLAGQTRVVSPTGKQVRRRVFHPLVSRPVRVKRRLGTWELQPQGDSDITPLVGDRSKAHGLEGHIEFGGGAFSRFDELTPKLLDRLPRLKSFAHSCASAAGYQAAELTLAREQPEELMRHDGVRIVLGLAVYTTDEPGRTTRAGSLLAWPDSRLEQPTAFHALYGGLESTPEQDRPGGKASVDATLPLTLRQAKTISVARERLVTVVSGGPGTGKSHTLVSVVCDALRRGESVLVATKNDAAVDALIDLLARQPGITPVVFGASERRTRLAQRLAAGELQPSAPVQVEEAEHALRFAIDARDGARLSARFALRPEWCRTPEGRVAVASARRAAPGVFADGAGDLAALVEASTTIPSTWFRRRRRRSAERELRRRAGAGPDTDLRAIVDAVDVAMAERCVQHLNATEACEQLYACEAEVRGRLASWLSVATRSPDRLDRAGLAAVATLATALRSGRSARRVQLERLHDRALTRALPVWMGTLRDVDDLLPPVPALFDLVLIDEASSTEQTIAASTLLRGRRTVVGDPRQLRHVSFSSVTTRSPRP